MTRLWGWVSGLWRELVSTAVANPVAVILLAILIIGGYEFRKTRSELQEVCDLTGDHDFWTVTPKTAREEIDDICIGQNPDDAEDSHNP